MKSLTLLVCLLGALTLAHAENLRSEIDLVNHRINAAIKKKDPAALEKTMRSETTPDFTYTEAGRTQNRDEMIRNMKAGLGMMDKLTVCTSKLLTLKQNGDKAAGTAQHTMVGTMKGADKKTHTMTFTGVAAYTYAKQGGAWKISSMTWKYQKQLADGKPVPQQGG